MRLKRLNDLSPCKKRLVELMREINFGQIECLHVRCGEPCFTPHPLVIEDIDLARDRDNGPSACCPDSDFLLKKQVVNLFNCLEKKGDGIVRFIVVQNGLPVRMKLERPYRD
jgi:hypothetical protein